jgi:hypothetical protein
MRISIPALFIATSYLASGCVIDTRDDSPPPTVRYVDPPAPVQVAVSPIIVVVDADKTMDAKGGEGVGVFVEYKSGGKWQISWTCDSRLTGQSCAFTHTIQGSQISNLLVDDVKSAATQSEVRYASTLGDSVGRISFDAAPGASITVKTLLEGDTSQDGRYFFFVQDGKVNGGFAGRLTNPLTFQPK